MKKLINALVLALFLLFTTGISVLAEEQLFPNKSGTGTVGKDNRYWRMGYFNQLTIPEITAPSGNPAANTGWLYVKDAAATTKLYFEDSAGTVTDLIAAASGNTLDSAYDEGGAGVGRAITVDSGAVALTNNAANNNGVLTIEKTPVGAQSGDAATITVGANATGDALQFANSGSGNDINGSGSLWYVTKAGAATFVSGTYSGNVSVGSLSTTGAWTIGDGGSTVAINSSGWDITTAGAVSGISSIALTGDITMATGKGVKSSTTTAESVGVYGYDVDGVAYVGALVVTNSNTPATVLGNSNGTTAITSSDWAISTTGAVTGVGAITADGLFTGSLGATVTGAAVNLNASSNFGVNVATGTSTGTVTVGGAGIQAIDIGNGAAAKTVALGSSNSTSTTTLLSGSGGILLNGSNNQPTTINGGTSTGTVTIGNTTPAIVNVLGTVSVNTNAAALATNIGTGTTTGTVTIGGAGIQAIDIGNGAAAKTVALGSSNSTSTTTILSGSGGILLNNNNNHPTSVGTGTSTGTVTIGGAGIQSIDIGNGAAAKTVALGSSNTTSTTTISAGSGKINLVGTLATGDAVTGDGTAALGGFLATVLDDTDAHTVLASESGTVLTNAGAGGPYAHTLPAAAVGLNYTFVVMAAQELRVTPGGGDVVNIAGIAGDAAEYWTANAVGEALTIVAVDATNWIATSFTGTWTQQTP